MYFLRAKVARNGTSKTHGIVERGLSLWSFRKSNCKLLQVTNKLRDQLELHTYRGQEKRSIIKIQTSVYNQILSG